jgi:phospholipid-binding lipoprotein MlaA
MSIQARLCLFCCTLLLFCSSVLVLPAACPAADAGEVDFLSDDFYDSEPEALEVGDPLESFNRAMYHLNDFTYTWLFNPVAVGYSHVVPSDIRGAVGNFFYNLEEPLRFANALLQGRFSDAGTVLVRFLVNSTGGVAGLGDPAGREMGFEAVDATLGETLGVWGIGDGFYLVVPFYGPSTLRDFSGDMLEGLALAPYYYWADGWEEVTAIYLGKELNKLSLHLGEYEDMKNLSFDPYIALRNGYFQYRQRMRDHNIPYFEE